MNIIQKAIHKAVLLNGEEILRSSVGMCRILEDLVPELVSQRERIQSIYTDELGGLLADAYKASFREKPKYRKAVDDYLLEKQGLGEERRREFLNIYEEILVGRMVEVKKYRDYKPALYLLKKEYGDALNNDVIQNFVEVNKLFSRFSITIDDVIRDLSHTYL